MKVLLSVGAFVAGVTFGSAPSEAQQRWPLFCKGANFTFQYLEPRRLFVRFNKGGASVSVPGMQRGECRWGDRGFRSHEPNMLCFENIQGMDIAWFGKNPIFQFSATRPSNIGNLLRQDAITLFHVYNDGNGCMKL